MNCRVCHCTSLKKVWDFGPTPLANSLRDKPDQPETYYPLQVYFCPSCKNVQLGTVVSPDLLFKKYLYASSTSKVFRKHFEDFASRMKVGSVVDIGSNDGILLKPFQKKGVKVVGVEPSNVKASVPTIRSYFTRDIARKIGKVDLITCMNTFAHIDNLDEIVRGVKLLMRKDSLFVIEVQYLMDQLQKKLFDNVYHEHVQYWSVTALRTFFLQYKLYIKDVEFIPTHGGSIRVFVTKEPGNYVNVTSIIRNEDISLSRLSKFQSDVEKNKLALLDLLYSLKRKGKKIIGYGAPAKASTLLHYFGIGRDIIDYIVDDSPLKQGKFIPGKSIPIKSKITGKPDYILILAWNFADSIIRKYPSYTWIIPNPKVRTVWS